MKNEFTLRVVLSDTLHANLSAHAKRTGLSLSNITRCCLVTGLAVDADDAEIDALIAKLQAKRAKRLPAPHTGGTGGRADADGGSEERKGGGE